MKGFDGLLGDVGQHGVGSAEGNHGGLAEKHTLPEDCRIIAEPPSDDCKRKEPCGEAGHADQGQAKADDALYGAGEQEMERHARTLSPGIRDDGRNKVLAGLTKRIDGALQGLAIADAASLEQSRQALEQAA